MIDETQLKNRSYGADGTNSLFVSLFLLILAFFIVLQSVSTQTAARSEGARESVRSVFRPGEAEAKGSDARSSFGNDLYLAGIATQFEKDLGVSGDVIGSGEGLRVHFPVHNFYNQGATSLRTDRHAFLNALLETAQKASLEGAEMAFFFGANTESQMALAERRAAALGAILESKAGVRGYVGIAAGPQDRITAIFRRQDRGGMHLNPWPSVGENVYE